MTDLSERQRTFLEKFAALCDEFEPVFFYTVYDDGIHIAIDDLDIFNDYEITGASLRKAL